MRTATRLLLLLALAGCAGAEALRFPGPERAGSALSEEEIGAIAEVLRYEDQRRWDGAAFERLVAHTSLEVRRRAVTAAGRIGDPAAAPLLLDALRTAREPEVRADAAFALGELGDTARAVVDALQAAVPARWAPVRDEETTVVVEILGALGKIGTPAAGDVIADALRDAYPARDRHSARIASEALLASWRVGAEDIATSAITPFIDASDPELRWRAVYALMRLARPGVTGRLLAAMADPDHRSRAHAARGLRAPLADSAGIRTAALAELDSALTDPHPHVRINALNALGTFEADAPLAAIAARLRDEDRNVAIAAASALGRLGARAADTLAAAATAALPGPVRAAALAQLAAIDLDRAWTTIEAWSTGDLHARWVAARTLGAAPLDRARPLLDRLARDRDARVAVAALQTAGAFALDSAATPAVRDAARRMLLGFADSPDPHVRAAAAHGLEREVPAGLWGAAPERVPVGDDAVYRDIVRRYVAGPLSGGERPRAVLRTAAGELAIELLSEEAPLTVHNFVRLAEAGYYDDGVWHRVVPNFVLQDGAPAGLAEGGPGWAIRDEINRVRYSRGAVGMALSGPDTGGSQWFITHSPQPHLDGGYTVFGRVDDGMDVADRVVEGDPITSIRIQR